MTDKNNEIDNLLEKLKHLIQRQNAFSNEIIQLKNEIYELKSKSENISLEPEIQKVKKEESIIPKVEEKQEISKNSKPEEVINYQNEKKVFSKELDDEMTPVHQRKSNLEKFIGENLINKIGILITFIGVIIGVKYSIDNNLINPLTRIILGYLTGLTILGFGIKLKKNYESYSAVLVSGAMGMMYFVTYSAYDFYDLIPQLLAFGLMVLFTVFTVFAAINYNQQVIAHIGLVGAYAVPFLLSNDSGDVVILFSYISIINIGILFISFKKYWKSLYYSTFAISWIIFFSWFFNGFSYDEHLMISLSFSLLFFLIFYITFLSYKLIQKEEFAAMDIILLILNSSIYFGIGYYVLDQKVQTSQYLGLFTIFNGIIHFVVSVLIYKKKLNTTGLLNFVSGLVLIFLTISIPVQLDGNGVTLIWTGLSVVLFWVGRKKKVVFYEKVAYAVMILAFISLIHDWDNYYERYYPSNPQDKIIPILNVQFLTSVLFCLGFGLMTYLRFGKKLTSDLDSKKGLFKYACYLIPVILFVASYSSFSYEIDNYWTQLYRESKIETTIENAYGYYDSYRNDDYQNFNLLSQINFTFIFLMILSWINIFKIKNKLFGFINLVLVVLTLFVFVTNGTYALDELRETYLEKHLSEYYNRGVVNILVRYITLVFVGLTLFVSYKYIKQKFMDIGSRILVFIFNLVLNVVLLVVLSTELINWLEFFGVEETTKLGLSILWALYSLVLVGVGIWRKNKNFRIGAIILFAITLSKLFLYDISHLNTISKTIVFLSLGTFLLIISFLYNKYTSRIDEDE